MKPFHSFLVTLLLACGTTSPSALADTRDYMRFSDQARIQVERGTCSAAAAKAITVYLAYQLEDPSNIGWVWFESIKPKWSTETEIFFEVLARSQTDELLRKVSLQMDCVALAPIGFIKENP